MKRYAKALVALAALLAALGKALSDGTLSSDEIGTLVPVVVAVPGVWAAKNHPG